LRTRSTPIQNNPFGPGRFFTYWTLNKSGDFFTLVSLLEDDFEGSRSRPTIQFDTRICNATEAVLHCAYLCKALGADPNAHIEIAMRYKGLRGRKLGSGSPARYLGLVEGESTLEDEVSVSMILGLGTIKSLIVETVKKLCEPLFMVFDFSIVPDEVYRQIVSDFINGKVS
jgi:hypothetical protein